MSGRLQQFIFSPLISYRLHTNTRTAVCFCSSLSRPFVFPSCLSLSGPIRLFGFPLHLSPPHPALPLSALLVRYNRRAPPPWSSMDGNRNVGFLFQSKWLTRPNTFTSLQPFPKIHTWGRMYCRANPNLIHFHVSTSSSLF